ncbi:hypothetical protein [Pontibaca methylaminivorans]|uniref:Uncharacterized protein n=1 Tax=Pontibaca methylaminivorans TaxID=515897 RepID=A0A1R3WDK7_9RHOB|nr:hypothetical protein [Pontibaca methylaminivorans]SIT76001.1 hypothetical protein SAMN05421849_0423 [Pontibaca methylaminivorans]
MTLVRWLALALLLGALLALELLVFGGTHLVFLARRLFDLIEWIAFWR